MTFSDVADLKDQLIRKALQGVLLVAPYSSAALTTISTTGGALSIDTDYKSIGKLSTDGSERSNEQEISDIFGWGDTSAPARRDVDRETTTLNVTAIETRRRVLELYDGVDLSTVVASANHEVKYDKPLVPVIRDWRTLLLAKDINKANGLDVYIGLHFPRANFTVNGGQTLQPGDNPLSYPMTVTAMADALAGTGVRTFLAGPGMAGLKADMGFAS